MKTRDIKSYYGAVSARPGKLLLGGVPYVKSSRFTLETDAQAWVDVTREGNEKIGREVQFSVVNGSTLPPEIRPVNI